jgi:hypothetical protein
MKLFVIKQEWPGVKLGHFTIKFHLPIAESRTAQPSYTVTPPLNTVSSLVNEHPYSTAPKASD